MRYKVLFLAASFTVFGIVGVKASPQALILDENGKPFQFMRPLKLGRNRLGIPATTFELLGLSVSYDRTEKRLYIDIPESDIMVGLRAGEHRTYHPEIGYVPHRYSYPLSRKKNGRFYVSIRFMQQAFPDYFTCSWNKATQTVTIKRHRVAR